MVPRAVILFLIALLLACSPISAKITGGAGTDETVLVGSTFQASGFLNETGGSTTEVAVFNPNAVDCSGATDQVELRFFGFWDPFGTYTFTEYIDEGETFRFTNPSDSEDYAEVTVDAIFCGGDTPNIHFSNVDYQQTFHLSSGGNDANAGSTTGASWKTMDYAQSKLIDGSDLLIVSGTNANQVSGNQVSSGILDSPVIYRGVGASSILNYSGIGDSTAILSVSKPYIEYRNFTLNGACAYTSDIELSIVDNLVLNFGSACGVQQLGFDLRGNNTVTNSILNTQVDGYSMIIHNLGNTIHDNDIYSGMWTLAGASTGSFYNNNVYAGNLILNGAMNYYSGSTGNYWYSYTGIDANHNLIGDTPFVEDGKSDDYPQMDQESGIVSDSDGNPLENIVITQSGTLRNTTSNATGYYNLSTVGTPVLLSAYNGTNYINISVSPNVNNANFVFNATYTYLISGYISDKYGKLSDAEVSVFGQGSMTTDATGYYIFSSLMNGSYLLSVNKTGYFDASTTVNITGSNITNNNITLSSTTIDYDPSGYVNDSAGNPVYNVHVQLSNATWSDPCIGSSQCYTDSSGYWNTSIYVNGTYNYVVKKAGYNTLSSSAVFNIGTTNNNFTIVPSQGQVSGYITVNKSGSGSFPIQGDLTQLQKQTSAKLILNGNTIQVMGSPDGDEYTLRISDVDSIGDQITVDILRNLQVIESDYVLHENQPDCYLIRESTVLTDCLFMEVVSTFGEGESANTKMYVGYRSLRKPGADLLQFVIGLMEIVNPYYWDEVLTNLMAWAQPTIDHTTENAIQYDSSKGLDVTGYQDFDAGANDVYTAYIILDAESKTQYSAEINIGYSDNTVTALSSYMDTLYPTVRSPYRGTTVDFKTLDQNNDGIIRVWFKFNSDMASFSFYPPYLMALGASTVQSLEGVNVFSDSSVSTVTDKNGFYSLPIAFGTHRIDYYLEGYYPQNRTIVFNVSFPLNRTDIEMISMNKTVNTSAEYLYVDPNPGTTAQQLYAFYKTLDKINPLNIGYGGYSVRVCPAFGGDCDEYQLNSQTESKLPLNGVPIGEYTISMFGYKDGYLDFGKDLIVTNNFTVTSASPAVHWLADNYYLGQNMTLTINVPSGYSLVTVYYPNNSILFANNYSATGILISKHFMTDSNASLNTYPIGVYRATITSGNVDTTQLLNVSVSAYNLTAPSSVTWGSTFTVSYVSPEEATLYITDQNNKVVSSQEVIGSKSVSIDTRNFPEVGTVLKIQLIRSGNTMKSVTVTIGTPSMTDIGVDGIDFMGKIDSLVMLLGIGLNTFSKLLFALIMIAVVAFMAMSSYPQNSQFAAYIGGGVMFIIFIAISYIPLWVIIFAAIIALGKNKVTG